MSILIARGEEIPFHEIEVHFFVSDLSMFVTATVSRLDDRLPNGGLSTSPVFAATTIVDYQDPADIDFERIGDEALENLKAQLADQGAIIVGSSIGEDHDDE